MMAAKKKAAELVEAALRHQKTLLNDPKTPPKLKFEITKDILDRGGIPRITASKVSNTTQVIGGAELRQEREMVLAEFREIKKELKQIEGGNDVSERDGEERGKRAEAV